METWKVRTHPAARPVDPDRQRFELALLDALDSRPEVPVLGICLGMQLMALHAGGRLDQYLPDTLATADHHWGHVEHEVEGGLGRGTVHSHHRQAVIDAGHLQVEARAPDGVIEAVRDGHRSCYLGVQWHPQTIEYLSYGATEEHPDGLCQMLATLGPVELEYAALRRAAGVMPGAHRATIQLVGGDVRDFLNRMLTAPLADLAGGQVRPAFWLNRKGRIESDLLVIDVGDRVLVDLDLAQAATTKQSLEEFVFAEDIAIEVVTDRVARLAVHGPEALSLVARAAGTDALALPDRSVTTIALDDASLIVARRDQIGAPGLELLIEGRTPASVVERLLSVDAAGGAGRRRVRPVGWYAYNMARIEGGTPLFNIDFGPTSLPHETGVLRDRVSFEKGCFVGQEVVARMEHLGRPKQVLVGLRVSGDHLPVAGGQVFAGEDDELSTPIGVVTSSTLSPMLGAAAIAFAIIKSDHAEPGRTVRVNAEGVQVDARVGPLRFWPEPSDEEPSS
jgi:folate-binding protein YgfZ